MLCGITPRKLICAVLLMSLNIHLCGQVNACHFEGTDLFIALKADTNYFHGENMGIYFNPLVNSISYNHFANPCERHISPLGDFVFHSFYSEKRYCYTRKDKPCNRNGEHYYFNADSLLVMSGYFENNKPHGVFWLYCDEDFPYCVEVSEYPVKQIIYHRGKKLLEMKLDSNGQPFGRATLKRRKFNWGE